MNRLTLWAALLLLASKVSPLLYEGDTCVDEHTGAAGRCTQLENCQSARDDLEKNGTRPTTCGFSRESVLVCCRDAPGPTVPGPAPVEPSPALPLALQPVLPVAEPTPSIVPVVGAVGGSLSERKCQEYSDTIDVGANTLTAQPSSGPTAAPKCDYFHDDYFLVTSARTTYPGEMPHTVAIGWDNTIGGKDFYCGGALISPRFVLTAAQCTYSPVSQSPLPGVVRLGDLNLDPAVSDSAKPIEVAVRRVHKHPQFTTSSRYDDIALLELESDVTYSTNIKPACLWTEPDFGGETKAVLSGWGLTSTGMGKKSKVLQRSILSFVDSVSCNKSLNSMVDDSWRDGLRETQFCAENSRVRSDYYQGEAGSPLILITDKYKCICKVVGVASFGPSGFGNNQPAVFVRVAQYLPWIESVVWPHEASRQM